MRVSPTFPLAPKFLHPPQLGCAMARDPGDRCGVRKQTAGQAAHSLIGMPGTLRPKGLYTWVKVCRDTPQPLE